VGVELINCGHAKDSRPEIKRWKANMHIITNYKITNHKSQITKAKATAIGLHIKLARDGFQGALPGAVTVDACEVTSDVTGVLAP
jgi:hypothetical protein